MRLSGLLYLYGRRLRTRPVQELLAGVGIAIGVALVFAVQVANSSITDASSAIVRGIAGTASLQLRARDASGFDEGILPRVQGLSGVSQAAPILDENASLVGPGGRRVAIDLASAAPSLIELNGSITHSISLHDLSTPGVILPSATARALGLSTAPAQSPQGQPPRVLLDVRGRAIRVAVIAVLGQETIGNLSGSMAAIAPLAFVQRTTGLTGRVTRILVTTQPGQRAKVQHELTTLAGGRLTVASADQDVALLEQAVTPNTEATGFFVLVSAIVGLLLAFNAMLLTVPERRRVMADLRMQGVRPWQLARMLMFQAVCLGVVATLVGLVAGDFLSHTIFHTTPTYLSAAFPLGTQTVIGLRPLLLSFAGGVIATCLAAAPPLLDLRRSRAVDAVYFEDGEPGQALNGRAQLRLFLAAGALILATSGPLIVWPSAIVPATIGVAVATLLAIPFLFQMIVRLAERVASYSARLNMLTVAVRALRATTVRSLALAATGAIAVFGCVVAEDSHNDLLHGLYSDYSEYVSTADLWVVNNDDDLATAGFRAGRLPARIAAVPGVAAVRAYRGGFLDFDGRRMWIIARAPGTPAPIPASQVQEGNVAIATARLRAGGWITVSEQVAEAHHVRVGDTLTLPTPSGPVGYRIAATTTNLGWSAGAIVIGATDYRRAWASTDVSALEVSARPRVDVPALKRAVAGLLGPGSSLAVQTSGERAAQADALARQGLSRMSQITLLLMIAAALAMAAAIGAGIWQRRSSLASLRIHSFTPWQLRGVLACESILVLGTGGLAGAASGIYGHLLCDRYLRLTTGFPAPFAFEGARTVQTILLIVVGALAVLAIPGYVASQAPPQLALQD
ncbi:MAG TPA: ABC transporter permease [Solirubrobacteraceae bacterium]|jgi:putative ABC transport system permease protein|nr:ABC transporter permease [Solirubrobacteraceae bacterium]